jgi:hypothetical protein
VCMCVVCVCVVCDVCVVCVCGVCVYVCGVCECVTTDTLQRKSYITNSVYITTRNSQLYVKPIKI